MDLDPRWATMAIVLGVIAGAGVFLMAAGESPSADDGTTTGPNAGGSAAPGNDSTNGSTDVSGTTEDVPSSCGDAWNGTVLRTTRYVGNSTAVWCSGRFDAENINISAGRIQIKQGKTVMRYWQSPTLSLEKIRDLVVYTDIPASESASAHVNVMTSSAPDFEPNGSFSIAESASFPLFDGRNPVGDQLQNISFSEQYYRITFRLARETPETPTPAIESFVLTGQPTTE